MDAIPSSSTQWCCGSSFHVFGSFHSLTCVIRLGWNKIVESKMESFHVFMRQCTALYVLALHQIRHVQPCKLFLLLLFFFPFQDSDIFFPSSYFVFQPSIPGRVAQKHQQTVNLTAGMLDRIIARCEPSGLQLNSDYD